MPAPLEQLQRGTIALALYPFTYGFPLEVIVRRAESELMAAVDRRESIESVESLIEPGAAPEVITRVKLRRVLLLQDGTSSQRQDVTVARINSVSDATRARRSYEKLRTQSHPAFFRIGDRPDHGTAGREAYVNLLSVAPINKATILRRMGRLTGPEMREISNRLVATLELDVSQLDQPSRGAPATAGHELGG